MATSVPVNEANTSFFLALFKKLSEDDNTANIFFSPLSISAALAMVLLGASGNTAEQMSEVLGFTKSTRVGSLEAQPSPADVSTREPLYQPQRTVPTQMQQSTKVPSYLLKVFPCCPQCLKAQTGKEDEISAKFAELLGSLYKDKAPYDLSLANRLFGDLSYEFVEKFLEDTKKYYGAGLESLDFQNGAEEARVHINGWVEKQTQGKVMELLTPGIVDNMTRLVLVNAIYFKGKWAEKFREEDTVDAEFRINKTDTRPVKMMRQKTKFLINSIPEINVRILEMPYEGGELSMFIFLPNDIEDETTGLEKLQKELSFEKFKEWTSTDLMGRNTVEVRLPRFKMEEKYDLNEVLKSMGMVDAFDVSRSNFSAMSPANNLVLSKVVHKAFVEVNEDGTEAAAATGAVMSDRALILPDLFNADHPFLFFIQHNPTKTVLFAGRCSSPE